MSWNHEAYLDSRYVVTSVVDIRKALQNNHYQMEFRKCNKERKSDGAEMETNIQSFSIVGFLDWIAYDNLNPSIVVDILSLQKVNWCDNCTYTII